MGTHLDSVEREWFCKHLRYLPCGWISDPSSAKYTRCWLKKSLYTSTKHSQIAALKCRAQTRLASRAKRRHFGRFCALQRYRNRPVRKKSLFSPQVIKGVKGVKGGALWEIVWIWNSIENSENFLCFPLKSYNKVEIPYLVSFLFCVPWAIFVLTRQTVLFVSVYSFQFFNFLLETVTND